ncbi:MAG: ABC transporter substrate-binding protein [Treponema sp.]|nr:ABC transporter substrate-binding protein [Treponema sp.]
MKKLKMVMFFVLCIVMTASLWATGASDNVVTLRFSWWGTDARHEATLAVIDAFHRQYPNIRIEPEYGAQAGYNEKKTTEFASRTAPDIFQIETGAGPEYQRLGVLYNLSRLNSISFEKFSPSFLVANGQFGTRQQYAIPTGMAGTAVIVNKTLADRLGIDFTRQYDWEQLITWGQQVRAADPTCYLLSVNQVHGMPFFVRAYARQIAGMPIIDDANKRLNMTEAQFTQLFDFIDRLYKTGTAAPAAYKASFGDQDQNDPNWIAGKYVASVGYGSNAAVLQSANPSVQYIAGRLPLLPNKRDDGWFNNTPQYMGIYSGTRYPEEAATFLNFFFNSEQAAILLKDVRSTPPTAFAQQIIANAGFVNPLVAQAMEVSMTYNGKDDAGFTTGAEVTAILLAAYEAVSFGTKTPQVAAREVVAQINDFLSRQ